METPTALADILHPMTVHFPIALILVSCLMAVIHVIRKKDFSMNLFIRALIFMGALGAWAAVITGSYHLSLSQEGEAIKHIHHNFANWTSWVISISAAIYIFINFYKKPSPAWLGLFGFITLIIAAVLVSITG